MISKANKEDIAEITQLVNTAYRGETSRIGWTTEADLFDGDRMSGPLLLKMMGGSDAFVYKYQINGIIHGCVYLKRENADVYLGMLTVLPNLQAKGIGKQLLSYSEEVAKQWNANRIYMKVINTRTELINWYLRHGYENKNQLIPFEGDGSDIPKQPISFTILHKLL